MMPKLKNISYEMRLKECGLTPLETRRLRGDQIEVFNNNNNNNNFIVQFIEWKYILHFGGCIKKMQPPNFKILNGYENNENKKNY